jgi:hypothetical protein
MAKSSKPVLKWSRFGKMHVGRIDGRDTFTVRPSVRRQDVWMLLVIERPGTSAWLDDYATAQQAKSAAAEHALVVAAADEATLYIR